MNSAINMLIVFAGALFGMFGVTVSLYMHDVTGRQRKNRFVFVVLIPSVFIAGASVLISAATVM